MTVRTCQDKGTKLPLVEQTLRRGELKKTKLLTFLDIIVAKTAGFYT
jgi:hypothetical protein